MNHPSLIHQQIELLAANFKPDEIDEIGKRIVKGFDSHRIAGIEQHITLSSRKCAAALIDVCNQQNTLDILLQMIVELDGKTIFGRPVHVDGLEELLNDLIRSGLAYDFKRKKFGQLKKDPSSFVNWGSLKDGKMYNVSVMSLDIVNNSGLVKRYGQRAMGKLYFSLRQYLQGKVALYDGRIWNFAGDGGIIAFTFKEHETRAVLCGLDIQRGLPLFAMASKLELDEALSLRLGLCSGKLRFMEDTGSIVSEVINYAAHLEKQVTPPGQLSVSAGLKEKASPRVMSIFEHKGSFEGQDFYQTKNPLDIL